MTARKFVTSWSRVKLALPMGTCTTPRERVSARYSTRPPLNSVTARPTSGVTVPVLGFGMRPRVGIGLPLSVMRRSPGRLTRTPDAQCVSGADPDAHGAGGAGDLLLGRVEIVGVEVGHLGLGDLRELLVGDRAHDLFAGRVG